MINVNLRPGLKRKTATSSPLANLGGLKEQFSALTGKVKDPMLAAAVGAWVVVALWIGWTWLGTSRELAALEPRLEEVRAEHDRFQTFIEQKRRQEAIRDSLVTQIGTIRQVDGSRYIWPHILDEVAKALPPYTWLVNLGVVASAAPPSADPADSTAPPPLQFEITGRTVDIQGYTRFLRQLEASPWLVNVRPISAQTVVEQERAVTGFTLRATYEPADSAYLRTVPFNQSVR